MQRAALNVVHPEHSLAEAAAIQDRFGRKRRKLLDGLRQLGIRFDREPEGTFYAWGDLSGLPPSIRNAEDFFHRALEHQVICVPGPFFDVDPGGRRVGRPSRFRHHVRFSFGPSEEVLDQALERLGEMIRRAE
jgi:hypothetical protein